MRVDGSTSLPQFDPEFAGPADWARMYRSVGLQVVPCRTPEEDPNWKRPAISEWKTLQEDLVPEVSFLRWYGRDGQYGRRANMGLITGRCSSNIFVIDLDDHKTPQAAAWWTGLLQEHYWGREPHTWQQRTGGGGRQLFFRGPKGWTAPTNKTPIGVDIRGQRGFAVMPPSIHETKREYAWAPDCAPWEVHVEDAAPWLIRAIEALVAEHGGSSTGTTAERTPSPGNEVNAFGARIDGREEYMRDMVWAAVVDWCRESPIKPPEDESRQKMLATYQTYLRSVKTRFPGVDTEEGLEREGRGLSLFQDKWARAMAQWEPKVQYAAMEARPKEEAKPEPKELNSASGVHATPFQWVEAKSIPPREWIYDRHYIRKFVSTTVAPGGLGKSSLITVEALAIASGRPVLHRQIDEPVPVWLWNGEDPMDELNRRIMATALHHKIDQANLQGRFFVDTGRAVPIVIAERTRDGIVINAPLIEQVIQTIQINKIGLMIIDPFIACHRVTENDNSEIDRVAKVWASIADITGCAIELVHHVRKTGGNEVLVEDGRGAVALLSAARAARALNRMTPQEAVNAGVKDHRFYFRADDGKANLAPPSDGASWFELTAFDLGNATAKRPSDSIGVVRKWEWPDHMDGVTTRDMEAVREAVRLGNFRADSRSEDWVGKAIIEALGLTGENAVGKAKHLQKIWVRERALIEVEELDERRRPRKFIRSGSFK